MTSGQPSIDSPPCACLRLTVCEVFTLVPCFACRTSLCSGFSHRWANKVVSHIIGGNAFSCWRDIMFEDSRAGAAASQESKDACMDEGSS